LQPKPVIVGDAGPLIALSNIECLALLPKLFSAVIIPTSVAEECLFNLALPGAKAIKAAIDQRQILLKADVVIDEHVLRASRALNSPSTAFSS